MSAHDWLMQFLVGATFGALGQGLRVIVGLKKVNDSALAKGQPFTELFSAGTLVVSLLIGAIAGVLGTLSAGVNLAAITRENIMMLIGVGYAGADFIEGFVRKELPSGAGGAAPGAGAGSGGEAQDPNLLPPVG